MTLEQTSPPAKKITARELKLWLSGVEEMQDDGWSPSKEQWLKIRAKISQLDDTVSAAVSPPQFAVRGGAPAPTTAMTQPVQQVPQTPAPPSTLVSTPIPQSTLLGQPIIPGSVPLSMGDGMKVKTPDIDTSTGKGYVSSFG